MSILQNLDFSFGNWDFFLAETEAPSYDSCKKITPPCIGATLLTSDEVRYDLSIIPPVPNGLSIYVKPFFSSDQHPVSDGYDYNDHWWTKDRCIATSSSCIPVFGKKFGYDFSRPEWYPVSAKDGVLETNSSRIHHYVRPALLCDLSDCDVAPGEIVKIHNDPYVILDSKRIIGDKPYCLALRVDVLDYDRSPGGYNGSFNRYKNGGHVFDGKDYENSQLKQYVDAWFQKEFAKEYKKELASLKKREKEEER